MSSTLFQLAILAFMVFFQCVCADDASTKGNLRAAYRNLVWEENSPDWVPTCKWSGQTYEAGQELECSYCKWRWCTCLVDWEEETTSWGNCRNE